MNQDEIDKAAKNIMGDMVQSLVKNMLGFIVSTSTEYVLKGGEASASEIAAQIKQTYKAEIPEADIQQEIYALTGEVPNTTDTVQ